MHANGTQVPEEQRVVAALTAGRVDKVLVRAGATVKAEDVLVEYAVTRLMASVLFGVSATDPPTFIGITVILGMSAVIAAWLPAARATRVDPMVALRTE
ncbi:MAG: hypothetical protein E6K80_01360 [Candidatus Eisenbacteria bacterium]|uniref:ABC3 transporter permease protein domain-containing protein n=1 Tax=Eiseniibacteriota bacterium TaxID=2212470 RepID=A0A538UAM7_UNCEI|nr:MAG: hypothetical protein E6K80_01360 [Candidatus Eisenbacteria bacterium]